jgi:hypothetical protein
MDRTNRRPADQLALKAASLLAAQLPRPASAHSLEAAKPPPRSEAPERSIIGRGRGVWKAP